MSLSKKSSQISFQVPKIISTKYSIKPQVATERTQKYKESYLLCVEILKLSYWDHFYDIILR